MVTGGGGRGVRGCAGVSGVAGAGTPARSRVLGVGGAKVPMSGVFLKDYREAQW